MEAEHKPIIGVVTGRRDENGKLYVNPNIEKVITELGGVVRPFNYETLRLYELIGEVVQIDGFIFPGGGDLNPGFYGQEKKPECGEPVRALDELELNLFPLLMTRMLPMLGICRGCQVINVGFGGTLIQDLPSQCGVTHRQGPEDRYLHKVHITPGTRLAACIGKEEIDTNSLHHQAVDEVAPGFKVSARCADGTVEAIESAGPGQFIVGVQWHPELTADDPESRAIFEAFMGAVVKRMSIKCSHEEEEA